MNRQKLSIITLLTITLATISVSFTYAQNVQDSVICYGYGQTDLQPIGEGNTVFQYTEKIGLWVQIQNPADASYRIIWEDPTGSQFRNQAVSVIEKSGADWGIVFDSINIAETTARNKLGVWTVSLFIDGESEVEAEFQIINYESLLANIQAIQQQVQTIIEEKDNLLAQNAELQSQLEALQDDYETLQEKVGSESEFEQLQEDYDDLLADYASLKASQSSTKTMMYAAIIVALVAIVVAVYFGVLKK